MQDNTIKMQQSDYDKVRVWLLLWERWDCWMGVLVRFFHRNRTNSIYVDYTRDLLQELAHVIVEARSPVICKLENQESWWWHSARV